MPRDLEVKRQWQRNNPERANAASRRWYAKNREKRAEYDRKRREVDIESARANERAKGFKNRYGMTMAQWDGMYEQQLGLCLCCGDTLSRDKQQTHVEHCHETDQVFGLVCRWCNAAVGYCLNSADRALWVLEYIKRTRGSDIPEEMRA